MVHFAENGETNYTELAPALTVNRNSPIYTAAADKLTEESEVIGGLIHKQMAVVLTPHFAPNPSTLKNPFLLRDVIVEQLVLLFE